MPFDKANATGHNCKLHLTPGGHVLVQSRNTGPLMQRGIYTGRGPFEVTPGHGLRPDEVRVAATKTETMRNDIATPDLAQAFLFFDAVFTRDPENFNIQVTFEKEPRSELLSPEGNLGLSALDILFGGDPEDLVVKCELQKLWFHIYLSFDYPGRSTGVMGNLPFSNAVGGYNITFDVEESYGEDLSGPWTLIESKSYAIALANAALPASPVSESSIGDAIVATMGSVAISDAWQTEGGDHYIRFTNWNFELA